MKEVAVELGLQDTGQINKKCEFGPLVCERNGLMRAESNKSVHQILVVGQFEI